jgi:hypothetical protein
MITIFMAPQEKQRSLKRKFALCTKPNMVAFRRHRSHRVKISIIPAMEGTTGRYGRYFEARRILSYRLVDSSFRFQMGIVRNELHKKN